MRPGSLQKDYDFYVSSDPAFIKPPEVPDDDATDTDREAFKTAAEEYVAAWKAARETTDYKSLIAKDASPKKFVLGRVNRNIWRAIQDRATLPAENPRHIGFVSMLALLTRLALRDIPALDLDCKHVRDEATGWAMAPAEVIEILDEQDPSIVGEIGNEVLRRLTQGATPGAGPLF